MAIRPRRLEYSKQFQCLSAHKDGGINVDLPQYLIDFGNFTLRFMLLVTAAERSKDYE